MPLCSSTGPDSATTSVFGSNATPSRSIKRELEQSARHSLPIATHSFRKLCYRTYNLSLEAVICSGVCHEDLNASPTAASMFGRHATTPGREIWMSLRQTLRPRPITLPSPMASKPKDQRTRPVGLDTVIVGRVAQRFLRRAYQAELVLQRRAFLAVEASVRRARARLETPECCRSRVQGDRNGGKGLQGQFSLMILETRSIRHSIFGKRSSAIAARCEPVCDQKCPRPRCAT